MRKAIVGLLGSSEFWTVVGQAAVEAVNAPVPDDWKVAGWVYAGGRFASKIAKWAAPLIVNLFIHKSA